MDTGVVSGYGRPPGRRASEVTAKNLAYVMYTSGSTGTPKGVMVEHGAAAGYIATAFSTYIALESGSTVLQLAPFGFDPSVREIIGSLAHGARLVCLAEGAHRDPKRVLEAIREHRVTVLLSAVPSFLRSLLELAAAENEPLALSATYVSGESARMLRGYGAALRQLGKVVNHYGTTECTMIATQHQVRDDRDFERDVIGRPIPRVSAYVLDDRLRIVDADTPGELCIGGPGIARGYIGDPRLTAARFVPDPFGRNGGARLYRTGDLARFRDDGELEYLGRRDDQVSIRGLRVDLKEVDAALCELSYVSDAAVAIHGDDDLRLVAFVVYTINPPSTTEIRNDLRRLIPEQMTPNAFVSVSALPRTATGKVDRRALRIPESIFRADRSTPARPRTRIERALHFIWSELLDANEIDRNDDFFERGGHSLIATQMVHRVRRTLGVGIEVHAVFESPTIASLAQHISAKQGRADEEPITPVVRGADIPLSFGQERLLFLDQMSRLGREYVIPFAVCLHGPLSTRALEDALNVIVTRHEPLRTAFTFRDGVPAAVVSRTPRLEMPLIDLTGHASTDQEADARRLAIEEMCRPFDLARPPLVRACVIRLSAREHIVVLAVHHIAADGWSFRVLTRELSALYGAHREGQKSPLAPLPIRYADYASWQRAVLTDEVLDEQVTWWRDELTGFDPVELPPDHPRPATPSGRGGRRHVALGAELTGELKDLASRERATPFMLLLSLFELLLARRTGRDTFSLATTVTNRPRAELEELIGFFINTIIVRADVSGDLTFRDLISRVREAAVAAYAHEEAPFERVVEATRRVRQPAQSAVPRVLVTFQEDPYVHLELHDLEVERYTVDPGSANFDLTIWLGDTGSDIAGWIEYSTDLYEPATIDGLMHEFKELAGQAFACPDAPLTSLQPVVTSIR